MDRSWYPEQRKQQRQALVAAAAAASSSGLPSPGYDSSSTGGPGNSGTSAASGGQRHALRLEGGEVWSPFSYAALQRVSGALGGTHSAVLPIKGVGRGLALEVGYVGKAGRKLCRAYVSEAICSSKLGLVRGVGHCYELDEFVCAYCSSPWLLF